MDTTYLVIALCILAHAAASRIPASKAIELVAGAVYLVALVIVGVLVAKGLT